MKHFHVNKWNQTPEKLFSQEHKTGEGNTFLKVDLLIITIPPKLKNPDVCFKKLLKKIEDSAIKQIIYTSSISIYGSQSGEIDETFKSSPKSKNAEQISLIEKLLLDSKNFKTSILRLGGLIGKNRHPAKYLSGKVINHPNELINLVHLDDCIALITKIISCKPQTQIFNVVNPYHQEKGIYYSTCCEKLNLPLPIIKDEKAFNAKKISSKKICDFLNYKFNNNLTID